MKTPQSNKPAPPLSAKRKQEVKSIIMGGLTELLGQYQPAFQRNLLTEYLHELDEEEATAAYERKHVKWTA